MILKVVRLFVIFAIFCLNVLSFAVLASLHKGLRLYDLC
jgi:DNA-directed RNA polymerase specialized sigma24 family protein